MQPPTQNIFTWVIARPVLRPDGHEDPHRVHVAWRAPLQGERLVQVYVDGRLVDVTASPTDREAWLRLDRSGPRVIELLAIDAADPEPWREHRHLLRGFTPPLRRRLAVDVARDPTLPVDAVVLVKLDGEKAASGPLWPPDAARSGFGGRFGVGPFGRDGNAGPGLGGGMLGHGPLGEGGEPWRFERSADVGDHALAVHVLDGAGRLLTEPWSVTQTIDAPPEPPTGLAIAHHTLTWEPRA